MKLHMMQLKLALLFVYVFAIIMIGVNSLLYCS